MAFYVMMADPSNYTESRAAQGYSLKKITIHHMAGNLTVQQLGALWQNPARNGSSTYGVQGDNIGQYVLEDDVPWTDSNWASNCSSITIETANSGGAPNWPVADNTLATLIRLVADIASRRGLGKLVKGQNLTWHSMYAATACPGPYLLSKMDYIVQEANKINGYGDTPAPTPTPEPTPTPTPSHGLAVGDKVTVNQGAKFINTSTPNPIAEVFKNTYDVQVVNGDQIRIGLNGAVTGWMMASSLTKVGGGAAPAPAPSAGFAVGDAVRVNNGAKDYNGTQLASFVYSTTYRIQELSGNRAVIGPNVTGAVTAAVATENLYKV